MNKGKLTEGGGQGGQGKWKEQKSVNRKLVILLGNL